MDDIDDGIRRDALKRVERRLILKSIEDHDDSTEAVNMGCGRHYLRPVMLSECVCWFY